MHYHVEPMICQLYCSITVIGSVKVKADVRIMHVYESPCRHLDERLLIYCDAKGHFPK